MQFKLLYIQHRVTLLAALNFSNPLLAKLSCLNCSTVVVVSRDVVCFYG